MIRKAQILLVILAFLVPTVQAGGPVIVDNGIACGILLDPYGNYIEANGKVMYASDGSGISMLICKGELATASDVMVKPAKAIHSAVHLDYASTNQLCITPLGETQDWNEVITPSGQATLVCRLNTNIMQQD